MKCENCGRNEANFVYRSNINGRTEEHHLCQACAEKLGYTRGFFAQRPSVMDSFFGNDNFFSSMEVQEEQKDNLMSSEEQSRFSYLRQMNALKQAQKKAIHEENFEQAAQLRDEIHQLEEAHKEAEASKKDAKDRH